MQITPCILFNGDAEAAMNFYLATFPDARVKDITRAREGWPGPQGGLIAATLELAGNRLIVLNGPAATASIAVSLLVSCDTQAEVDRLWEKLGEGGQPLQCGWVTDRFGVTWQIVPARLLALLNDSDEGRARRAVQAMMSMVKIDIDEIERAAAQDGTGG